LNSRYVILQNFCLPSEIEDELKTLAISSLEPAMKVDRFEHLKILRKERVSWFEIASWFNQFGFLFNRVGSINTYKIPETLEKEIIKFISSIDKDLEHGLSLRIQEIVDRQMVPLHVDQTKTTSLVYPLRHNQSSPALTKFYQSTAPVRLGINNPNKCHEVDSFCIDNMPALLDVTQIHSVEYLPESITPSDPRISLSLKWSTLSFRQVYNMLSKHVH
jgi:hypothetical protein